MAWLQSNLPTVIVAAVVVLAAALALFFTLRARRNGCSCGCASCPRSSGCKKK
ncbi:MAG: FeoB-associated Cys-rich membrane protein [Clostridia bacterium]|nr:FeoB-associated Cys-rich membrane protein [Clostridia bacterium]